MSGIGDMLNAVLAHLGTTYPQTLGWMILDVVLLLAALSGATVALLRARHWKLLYLASEIQRAKDSDQRPRQRLLLPGAHIGLVVGEGADMDAAARHLVDLLENGHNADVLRVGTSAHVPTVVMPEDLLVPGQYLTLPADAVHDADTTHPDGHTTTLGDTLGIIATRYGIPWSVLARRNVGLRALPPDPDPHDHTARDDVKG